MILKALRNFGVSWLIVTALCIVMPVLVKVCFKIAEWSWNLIP